MLGFVPWIVKCMKKAYRRVEELEAGSQQLGTLSPALREQIEWVIERCQEHETYLKQQLEGTINAVSGHEEMTSSLLQQISFHRHLIEVTESKREREESRCALIKLKETHMTAVKEMTLATEKLKQKLIY